MRDPLYRSICPDLTVGLTRCILKAAHRVTGTCTRVPTDVQMSRKDVPWSCSVVLRFEIDDRDGSQLEQVRNIDFDATNDPQKVAIILRRAQLAILNPSVSPAKFVTLDVDSVAGNEAPLGSTEQYQFSINTVCVYIEGPAVADLSLTDLPGIIQSGDAKEVALIKQMATRVIQDESCIILLAITMRGMSSIMIRYPKRTDRSQMTLTIRKRSV